VGGVHRNVGEREAAINAFLECHNAVPKPFRWAESADEILAAIERFRAYTSRPKLRLFYQSAGGW
jgi:hypothetical protein